MSSAYGRLSAIRDYWMPRNKAARAEVRVSDLDEVLTEYRNTVANKVTLLELKALQAEVLDGDLTKVAQTVDAWMARLENPDA